MICTTALKYGAASKEVAPFAFVYCGFFIIPSSFPYRTAPTFSSP